MQLLPVTKLQVLPFACILPRFIGEHEAIYKRRVKTCMEEIRSSAHERFRQYTIDSDDLGMYAMNFYPENNNTVAIMLLQRVPDLVTVLETYP